MRLKMTAAAQRLQSPDASVKEVAYELGFRDAFHFSLRVQEGFRRIPRRLPTASLIGRSGGPTYCWA